MIRVAPGGTLGILGAGQLGRMLALAAARLGIRCHVYGPDEDSPAFQVCERHVVAAYDDHAALAAFAASVDVVTYEFENVPVDTVVRLEDLLPVHPGSRVLAVTQDRVAEKTFANELDIGTAAFRAVDTAADLEAAVTALGLPAILKTRRLGYDGKGQAVIRATADLAPALAAMGGAPAILEAIVPFEREVSVLVVRGAAGNLATYDVTENEHRAGILHRSTVPARLSPRLVNRAADIAVELAEALEYVGVLGVEMFVTRQGGLLVNELAPRVHNSGHWTIEGCGVSQFENHVRAVCGWPLGTTGRHSDAEMINLIGEDANGWQAIAAEEGAALHLYGKAEARAGRKMGHVTRLKPRPAEPT